MLVAVTSMDETNASPFRLPSLFLIRQTSARIRSPECLEEKKRCSNQALFLSITWSHRKNWWPATLRRLINTQAHYKWWLCRTESQPSGGKPTTVVHWLVMPYLLCVSTCHTSIHVWRLHIFHQGRPIRPQGTTIIEADDEVFFVAASNHIAQ